MATAGSIMIYLGANTSGLTTAGRKVRTFERGVIASSQNITNSITSIGRALTALTIPIGIVGVSASKMFSDFEFSLARIEGLVGIAREQTQVWARDIQKIAPEVGQMPNKLADALYFVTSAGNRGVNTMKSLETAALASSAGMGDMKDIAMVMEAAMNAWGRENLTVSDSIDTIAMTVREGTRETSEMISAMSMIFPVAAQLGVSFGEVGAAFASITRTGTPGSTTGTQLRRVLSAFIKRAPIAEDALNEMGSSWMEMNEILQEEGLLAALQEIAKMKDIYGLEQLGKVFRNIREIVPILDLIGENFDENQKIFSNMEQRAGTFDNVIKAVSKTVRFQFNQAMAAAGVALNEVGHSISRVLIKAFKDFTKIVRQFNKWWKSLPADTQDLVVRMTALTAAIGPLMLVLNPLLKLGLIPLRAALLGLQLPIKGLALLGVPAMFSSWTIAILAAGAAILYMAKNYDAFIKKRKADENGFVSLMNPKQSAFDKAIAAFSFKNITLPLYVKKVEKANKTLVEARIEWAKFADSIKDDINLSKLNSLQGTLAKTAKSISTIEDLNKREDLFQQARKTIQQIAKERERIAMEALSPKVMQYLTASSYKRAALGLSKEDRKELKEYEERLEGIQKIAENSEKLLKPFMDRELIKEGKDTSEEYKEFFGTFMDDLKNTAGTAMDWIKGKMNSVFDLGTGDGAAPSIGFDPMIPYIITNRGGAPRDPMPALNEELSFYKNLNAVWTIHENKIEQLNKDYQVFGKSIDYVGEAAQKMQETLDEIRSKKGPFSESDLERIKEMTEEMRRMQTVNASINQLVQGMDSFLWSQETLDRLHAALSVLNLTKEEMQSIVYLSDFLTESLYAVGEGIVNSLKGVEGAFDSLKNIVISAVADIIKQLIKMLLVKGIISLFTGGLFGGIGGLGSLFGSMGGSTGIFGGVLSLLSATGMANGGIVPNGYPNDTFSARLSSKEAVIPLDELWSRLDGIGMADRKVVFYIDGDQLAGILEKQSKIYNAF